MNKNPLLDTLNKEQLDAVTTLEGPVLIVAGAGSGKTRVITHRIAYLLEHKKDLLPENILALTFSKKAAEEMQKRVGEMIDKNVEDITISTFHSFCHSILKEHGIEIGLKERFRLLDRIEQHIFFKNLLPDLKLDYYAGTTDFSGFAGAVLRFISRCKDELIDEDEYGRFVKSIADKEERKRSEEILAAYRLYQKKNREVGFLDFGGLIIKAIELLRKRKKILKHYQERYKYILVDEFQDTNVAQIELISMLAGRHKNICVVGDDDQAIYRFRGASYASFLKFQEHFPGLKKLKLTQNYRSTKKILKVAERLITQNDIDRYDPEKSLWTENGEGEKVEIAISPNYAEEARNIVKKIKDIHKKEGGFGKIAVLYRAHLHKEELLKLLKLEHIPHSISGGTGIFESDEVKEILAYLKALTDTADSASYFKLVSSVECDIDYADLVMINGFSKYNGLSLYQGLRKAKDIDVSQGTKDKIGDFLEILKELKRSSERHGLLEFLYQLIALKTSILKRAFVKQSNYGEPALQNVSKLYNLISQYALAAKRSDLHSLMEYLDAYIEAGGKMEDGDEPKNGYGVQLMTVHQAKGLEFPYVFVISLVQNRFPTLFRKEAVAFPEQLIKEQLPKGNFHIEEERRLLYVALTRAQKMLFLSGVQKSYSRPSLFISEIAPSPDEKNADIAVIETASAGPQGPPLESAIKIPLSGVDVIKMKTAGRIAKFIGDVKASDLNDKNFVSKVEKNIKTEFRHMIDTLRSDRKEEVCVPPRFKTENTYSFTQIESYSECPLRYRFTFIDKIPRRPKPYFSFGSTIHDVLKEFYAHLQKGHDVDIQTLLDIYNDTWISGGYKDKKEEKIYKMRGKRELTEFFNKNKSSLKAPLYIEKKFILNIEKRILKGFIDRIDELEDGSAEIIDYKTGKESKNKSIMQLDLYAIAATEKLGLDVSKLSFYYISGNTKRTFKRTPDNLEETKSKIIGTISEIESCNFRPKISYNCKFCNYQILCPAYNK